VFDGRGTMARLRDRTAASSRSQEAPELTSSETAHQPTTEDIAERAFEKYCARGYEHGHDVEDWLEAERELNGRIDESQDVERGDPTLAEV
jgi:hypothetical protein